MNESASHQEGTVMPAVDDEDPSKGAEQERVAGFGRLELGLRQASDWYLWGPYLAERQWGTVREDYSADGEAWAYLRTTTPAPAPTGGARTAWPASATSSSGCAWASPSGTAATRS